MTDALLEVENLSAGLRGTPARLLRSVSLSVKPGEVHGLVGESGAGKSMIARAVFAILPKAIEIREGHVRLGGKELLGMGDMARRRAAAQVAALIPQDPMTALNPSKRIEGQITERLIRIIGMSKRQASQHALELLDEVHLREPERVLRSYPHELSGGMRQRVLIAAAFAGRPRLIVADEPTTALDVTVQKQILRLIADMQQRYGTGLLFVTHNLGVVAKICQSVTVLYGGMVIEQASAAQLFASPKHEYTRALIAATPRYDRPEDSLLPVDAAVIDGLRADVARADAAWIAGRRA
jgi:peptide/nickel transport system ATP-binding protein